MFRNVTLPEGIPGTLYLHSMPGRQEELADFLLEAKARKLDTVVCLAPEEEIMSKSRDYFRAVSGGSFPVPRIEFPIHDLEVPGQDRMDGFEGLVAEIARMLRSGKNVLIHCAAGVGRTGTLCACVLFALGLHDERAVTFTRQAGAEPETREQKELVLEFYRRMKKTACAY